MRSSKLPLIECEVLVKEISCFQQSLLDRSVLVRIRYVHQGAITKVSRTHLLASLFVKRILQGFVGYEILDLGALVARQTGEIDVARTLLGTCSLVLRGFDVLHNHLAFNCFGKNHEILEIKLVKLSTLAGHSFVLRIAQLLKSINKFKIHDNSGS